MKPIEIILTILVIAVIAFLIIDKKLNPITEKTTIKEVAVVKYDTVYSVERYEPTIINKATATFTITKKDTVIKTAPFIATLDTIVMRDTIKVDYSFPQNYFNLKYLRHLDSIRVINKETIKFEIVKVERPLWLDIVSHSGAGAVGGLIGFGIGRIR